MRQEEEVEHLAVVVVVVGIEASLATVVQIRLSIARRQDFIRPRGNCPLFSASGQIHSGVASRRPAVDSVVEAERRWRHGRFELAAVPDSQVGSRRSPHFDAAAVVESR